MSQVESRTVSRVRIVYDNNKYYYISCVHLSLHLSHHTILLIFGTRFSKVGLYVVTIS